MHGENAWRVSDEIKQIIDDEPGPAGDFLKCFVTSRKEKQFFFNSAYLMKYSCATSESGKKKNSWKCLLQQDHCFYEYSL